MSVIINGMEMPKEQPLRIVLNPNGQLFVDHGVRFTEYEAVEVPTPHGRLIDADAIEYTHAIARCIEDGHNWNELCVTADEICDMPTIIEAEEE